MRKSALFLVLMAALLVAAAAVGPATAAPPTKVGVAYDIAGLGDNGFNDLTQAGALEAQDDFGVKLFELEQVKKNGDLREPRQVVERLARKSDMVVTVAFSYTDAVVEAVAAHPDTNFVVLDSLLANPPPNVLGTATAANEGSFLVGAAAALMSANNHIGFVGGVEFDAIRTFQAGYSAGAWQVTPSDPTLVEIAYAGTFSDQRLVYEAAYRMYEDGADVIFHAAGSAGYGLFAAARDYSDVSGTHVWAIGVDFDQYQLVTHDLQQHILTSMLKNVDVITYDVIEMQATGTFIGGNEVWDLARNGVGYSTSGGYLPAWVIDELDDLAAQIVAGDIVVPVLP